MARKTKRIQRFTKEVVAGFVPPAKDRVEWWDEVVPSLTCRVSYSGTKTFCWVGREGRGFKRVKLGTFPQMAVAAARDEAMRLAGLAVQGQPVRTRRHESRNEWTLRELHNWYMENHSRPQKRTASWDERQFENHLSHWEKRRVSTITRQEVQSLHVSIGEKNGTYAANKTLELLGHMYRMAGELCPEHVGCPDPTYKIKRFAREERERFLDSEELPKFVAAVEQLQQENSRDFMMLCLWTGARRQNVCTMRWEEINLKSGVWTVPKEKSKNKKAMSIPLSEPAIEILKRRKKTNIESPWVLPGRGMNGHYNCPRTAIEQIRKMSGIKDIRVHDLRRTLGSWMCVDNPLQIVGKQLGHSSLKATAIYARLATKTVKDALGKTTKAMKKATGKK